MKYNPLYFIVIFIMILVRQPFLNLLNNVNKEFFNKNDNLEIKVLKDKITYLNNEYEKLLNFKNNINILNNYTITNTIINNYSFKDLIINGDKYKIGSEVITEDGLIGIVTKNNKGNSTVEYIYNTNIVVKINDVYGKITSKNTDNYLVIKELSNYNNINLNDKVFSANGTYIGKVIKINKSDFDTYILVEHVINKKINYVAVIER